MRENVAAQVSVASYSPNTSVLITSPSYEERERLAKLVHESSARKNKPFVMINCDAFRETLFESELFGHEKSSFTGAYATKIGLAEIANGGTLFLDNIDCLKPGCQVQLLKLVKEGIIHRLGGKEPIPVNVKLLSGTRENLGDLVDRERFIEDLFYRINDAVIYGEEKAPPQAEDFDVGIALHEVEKRHILKVLKHYDNSKPRAAEALGITIKTLYNKLHLYGEL